MVSDRRNFRLLLEVGVAESNGVVRIAAKYPKIAVVRMRTKIWRKITKLCQIAKISVGLLIIGNQRR